MIRASKGYFVKKCLYNFPKIITVKVFQKQVLCIDICAIPKKNDLLTLDHIIRKSIYDGKKIFI